MHRYFKIVNARPGVFILKDNTRFDLRLGFPERSFDVWKTGKFKYLALKPAAKDLLSKLTIPELTVIAGNIKNIDDLKIIQQSKPSERFKNLIQSRIDVLESV